MCVRLVSPKAGAPKAVLELTPKAPARPHRPAHRQGHVRRLKVGRLCCICGQRHFWGQIPLIHITRRQWRRLYRKLEGSLGPECRWGLGPGLRFRGSLGL